MKKEFDVIIVGNGAIGCSIAIRLATENPDISIALVGNGRRDGSASMAAGMMLNLFAELESGNLSSPYHRQKFEMGLKAKVSWGNWVQMINELAGSNLEINLGTYVIGNSANTLARDDINFDYIIETLKAYQTPYELGELRDIKGYNPEEQYRAKKILYIPSEGSIETAKLFESYDKILYSLPNLSLIDQNAEEITLRDDGSKTIEIGDDQIFSKKMVLCAGAFTQKFIEQIPTLKKEVPRLFYGAGVGLHVEVKTEIRDGKFDLPDKVIRTASRGFTCGLNVVPYGPSRCFAGATSYTRHYEEKMIPLDSMYILLNDLMNEINKRFSGAFYKPVIGQRPVSADNYPLLGETSIEGLWIVSGTKREGFFLSPYIAESIANEINGGKSLTPSCFSPCRSLIYDLTREEAIDKSVINHVSYLYQHGIVLPKTGPDDYLETIKENYRKKIEKTYDDLGVNDFGIPPELVVLYKRKYIIPEA